MTVVIALFSLIVLLLSVVYGSHNDERVTFVNFYTYFCVSYFLVLSFYLCLIILWFLFIFSTNKKYFYCVLWNEFRSFENGVLSRSKCSAICQFQSISHLSYCLLYLFRWIFCSTFWYTSILFFIFFISVSRLVRSVVFFSTAVTLNEFILLYFLLLCI